MELNKQKLLNKRAELVIELKTVRRNLDKMDGFAAMFEVNDLSGKIACIDIILDAEKID